MLPSSWRINGGTETMNIVKETLDSQVLYTLVDNKLKLTVGKATLTDFNGVARLHTIYVKAEFRGRGYGERLMKKIIEDMGCKPIYLSTHYGGIKFFKRYDFEVKYGRPEEFSTLVEMVREPSKTRYHR
ncbi:MAG: GNAT family N-acetyltransferase [Candidatus Bathyarchaeia archaeon]